jgi:hypothetical protein
VKEHWRFSAKTLFNLKKSEKKEFAKLTLGYNEFAKFEIWCFHFSTN